MLKGRTAFITGTNRGIGKALVAEFARNGADVIAHARRETPEFLSMLEEIASKYSVKVSPLFFDMTNSEAMKTAVRGLISSRIPVDILVNNAGITRDNLILRMSEEDFDAVLNANLKGAFLCCKEAARRMVRQRWGRIVNLSSVVALRGNAGQTNYAASKAGLIGLTKSLAKELASRNVTVNAVAPGFIATDMTAALPEAVRTEMCKTIPEGHAGQPEDVANAVAFFAAEQSSYLTGQVLCVDGGMAM